MSRLTDAITRLLWDEAEKRYQQPYENIYVNERSRFYERNLMRIAHRLVRDAIAEDEREADDASTSEPKRERRARRPKQSCGAGG